MRDQTRRLLPWLVSVACLLACGWVVLRPGLPPADFTFNNQSEVKSLDPAIVTGSPENRVINALFQGLTRQHPKTLEAIPGVAQRWDISADGLVYTFHLRPKAKWSDNTPLTAHDFYYSLRRFLDPLTLAEYAYQAWYIRGARKYSRGARMLQVGDTVEVELPLPTVKENRHVRNTWRGELLHGTLVAIERPSEVSANNLEPVVSSEDRTDTCYLVEIGGQQRRFVISSNSDRALESGCERCRQLLSEFGNVGIRVIDLATLEITLENPTPYFLQLLAFYPLFPVNQRCVEQYGSPQWTYAENLVSNGAFRLQFRRIRDRIRVVRSDTYWDREHVRLGIVDMLAIDSPTTALNLYLTGELDRVIDPPPTALQIMRRQQPPRLDLNPAPYLGIYFYRVNTTRKPLDDVRVRRALSLALNRREITDSITGAGEQPALSLVPQSIPGYQVQQCASRNPQQARNLLAEAGYLHGDGFPRFQILYNTHQSHQAIAELIRKQWQQELGISVNTRNEEWASYLSSQRQLDYHLVRAAWIGDYLDANTFLDMFVTDGEHNNTGWGNAKYDDLIVRARSELNQDARLQLLQQAERILMDQLPIIPIYYYVSKNLLNPAVRGFYNNLQDHHPLSAIWIDHQSTGPNEFMQGSP
ncbi:MAG: peptide ABC transporter substrate-binding protein [Pirellulales bacterium]